MRGQDDIVKLLISFIDALKVNTQGEAFTE